MVRQLKQEPFSTTSLASFISECLAQMLCLSRSCHNTKISGVAGLSQDSPLQSVARFKVSPTRDPNRKFKVSTIVPHVMCDLPLQPIPFKPSWEHLEDLAVTYPDFGCPGKVDLLLGVDIFF